MVRLLSRSVAVLLIVALAASFAFAKVETYLGPSNADVAKWKESMQGKLATEHRTAESGKNQPGIQNGFRIASVTQRCYPEE